MSSSISPSCSGSSVDSSDLDANMSGGGSGGVSASSPSSEMGSITSAVLTVFSPNDGAEAREVVFPERVDFGNDFDKVLSTPTILEAPAIRHILSAHLCRAYEFVVPRPSDRACYPPRGFFTLYEDTLGAGLRFPLHSALVDLLNRVRIPIGQLAPNSFRQFVCLGVEAGKRGIPFSADLILKFFRFKISTTGYYLSPRVGQGIKVKTPSKIPRWQEKYFSARSKVFLFSSGGKVPWMIWSSTPPLMGVLWRVWAK